MAKLLISPPNRFHSIQRAASSAVHITTASPRFRCCPASSQPNYRSFHRSSQFSRRRRVFVAEFSSSSPTSSSPAADQGNEGKLAVEEDNSNGSPVGKGELPSDEFEIVEFDWWKRFLVRVRMLFALPWERVRKGSVLSMKLKGTITDQFKSSFSSGISLPQICENLVKAAHDPRISAVYLQIEPLNCGWGKVEEIRRHILNFRKSGKLIISYVPICGVKEYYLACACEELYMPPSGYVSIYGLTVQASFIRGILDKVGIEPQVQRIGRYKSAGDQLNLKSMSKENCEMLTTLLDNIYDNWLDVISSTQGKNKEEIVNFLDSGVFRVERLKEEGWITNLLYDDEITSMLKKKLGHEEEKPLRSVDFRRYSRVRKWTLGLGGQGDEVAVVRASGSISRARGPLSLPGGSGITSDEFIEKIRSVRESKRYKAVILRIDSPGGDALASDLMWREIRLLAASKPVVASMADVAASGGYYMAMGAQTIVAEKLTLTGSIGVVTGKFNLQKLYERIGFNKEIISRGKYAELQAAEQRPFREDEAELFEKSAQDAYARFRDKAAFSRSMTVDQMETVAQGRVWSGGDAASRGLIDAVGGFSLAVAIAKQKAGIPKDSQVKLVEVTRRSPSLPELVTGFGQSLFGLENAMKDALLELGSSGVQARVDGILFERLGDSSGIPPIIDLIKDCINSL